MTDTELDRPGKDTSEYRMTIRAAAIYAGVVVLNKAIEAVVYIMTGVSWEGIGDVQMGILAAALSGGAGVYTATRGSFKKAAAAIDPKSLAVLADKLVEAAKK